MSAIINNSLINCPHFATCADHFYLKIAQTGPLTCN